ncbi:MAG: hypothetical protein KatS3mg087_0557 [Patescibacteria group bacterium]|nr:MAG: hypothetical protein KatS3mg087_0557 [Patescibacteria group bacterium]
MNLFKAINWKWRGWDYMLFIAVITGLSIAALSGIIKPVPDNFDAVRSSEKIKLLQQSPDSTIRN